MSIRQEKLTRQINCEQTQSKKLTHNIKMSDKLKDSANVVSVGVSGGSGLHGYTEEETEAFR